MKPKYLIDECLDLKKGVCKNGEYLLSTNVLGAGAPDHEILDYAIKKNLILVTNDMKAALRTAMKNHPIVFYQREGKSFKINAEELGELSRKFSDSVTFYALENDEVVIP